MQALARRAKLAALGRLRASIESLAWTAGTDKIGAHDYVGTYDRLFSSFRNRRITLLEMGVGGYDRTDGGHSLRLWEAYFQRGTIVGIDLYDKSHLSHGRVHVHQCSQVDEQGLQTLSAKYGGFDLIIDDGSHLNEHQIASFKIIFPLLKDPGVYVVEDIQTSYWPAYGGGAVGSPEYGGSAMSFFKGLVDGLNHAEFLTPAPVPLTPYELSISGIYFEHNLVAILKGDNSGKSNVDMAAWGAKLEKGKATPAGLPE